MVKPIWLSQCITDRHLRWLSPLW